MTAGRRNRRICAIVTPLLGIALAACRGISKEIGVQRGGTQASSTPDSGERRVSGAASAEALAKAAWDWNGIIGTGQSLSVGSIPISAAATHQPYHNLALSLGTATIPPFDPTNGALFMAPLVEPIRPLATTFPSAYPTNLWGETPHSGMADQISAMVKAVSGEDYATVHTVVGESGQPMSVIDKGAREWADAGATSGRAYAASLFEVAAIRRLATAAGKTYGVGAIVLTHGESDAGNTDYARELVQLWSDYNQDIRAITGQKTSIPMFVSQQHAFGFTAGNVSGQSASTYAQWKVGVDHPGDILCTGPKYQYPYGPDNIHLMSRGYDLLGEKYGEIFFEKVILGKDWQPLQPTRVSANGRVITVEFNVPVPPLVWDETLPKPHETALTEWARGRGFEVSVNNGTTPLSIASVAIVGSTVQITCSATVPGDAAVAYAMTSDGSAVAGLGHRWGQLRDSDAVVGVITGVAQPNYCVAFYMAIRGVGSDAKR
jgi:hypothetical protein